MNASAGNRLTLPLANSPFGKISDLSAMFFFKSFLCNDILQNMKSLRYLTGNGG